MAAGTVRVTGWKETIRAFRHLEKDLPREMKKAAKDAAEPVAADARGRIGRYQGASTSTIKPYASQRGAVVRQSKGRVTGRKGQFGALQMRHLLGAAADNESQVRAILEKHLDRMTRSEGF